MPYPKFGEEVCAWIRMRDGVTGTAEEFREFCRGILDDRTGTVQKFRMRELTVAELTLARVTDVEPT